MESTQQSRTSKRYGGVTEEKAVGATYTPAVLADFVAKKIAESFQDFSTDSSLRVLDPAVGQGELLVSLLAHLTAKIEQERIEVYGFDTNPQAVDIARNRLCQAFPGVSLQFEAENFLNFTLENFSPPGNNSLFHQEISTPYDLVIANPPYVRTQVMGSQQARLLARQYGLSGRVDLYYAFVLSILQVLRPQGIAGIIVSNRFMTTKSGAGIRQALLRYATLKHTWDLGDTKLFDAAILPAVLLVEGKPSSVQKTPRFTSIYQTREPATKEAANPIASLESEGVVAINDGRHFRVRNGNLDTNGTTDGVWRLGIDEDDAWLESVAKNRWGSFRDVGKIRVGVKTCADKVFIRDDWQDMPETARPELLRPLTTHHMGNRFKAKKLASPKQILYAHEVVHGHRHTVDLAKYPKSQAYLHNHRDALEARQYLMESGRKWYEIWVPQNPDAWSQPKLVFRDIAETPTFWMDFSGSVVNGDCYWLTCKNDEQTDFLWLALAIGNSTFAERYYDLRFHNKLYAGRRRFIKQYVDDFPLPNPFNACGKAIISKAKRVYECVHSSKFDALAEELDQMVWGALAGPKII